MGTPLYSFLFFIVLIQMFKVNEAANQNGTCFKNEQVRQMVPQIFSRTVITNNVRRIVTYQNMTAKYVNTNVSYCCDGYETIKKNPLTCKPKCSKSCGNGTCIAPEQCQCWPGYQRKSYYSCKPQCKSGCPNGTCVGPETCACNLGFKSFNKTCQPVCSTPCSNATCIGPNACKCWPGYTSSGRFSCKPYCSSGCLNGTTCVQPNTCSCLPGYKLSNNKTCIPYSALEKKNIQTSGTANKLPEAVCSKRCINSTCVAPETCKCYSGYVKSQKYSCRPNCSGGCLNGVCVSPETCICKSGWKLTQTRIGQNNGTCHPICTKPCANGTYCVAPETCGCRTGYAKINGTCIVDSTKSEQDGEKNWVQSHLVYVLVIAIILLVLLAIIIVVISRCKKNSSE